MGKEQNKKPAFAKASAGKYTVCLVDDDEFFLKMYATKFKNSGFRVITAKNADEGLTLIKKRKPDIVFLDIYMPGKDGFYVLNKAKKNKDIKGIPVVILTNYDSAEIRQKSCKGGALYFISKAYKLPRELVEFTQEVLNNKA